MADPTPVPEPNQSAAETEIEAPPSRRRGILIVAVVVVVLIALGIWWRSTYSEDTDDAQVEGHLIQVSTRINGHVLKVDVDENQVVKAGDPIAELDPRDYEVAVENAKAALASAQANAAAANVNVPIIAINTGSNLSSANADVKGTHAGVEQAERATAGCACARSRGAGQYVKAQTDLERYRPLVEKDVISKQQFDAAVAAADSSKAALADARASEQAAEDAVQRGSRARATGASGADVCADCSKTGGSAECPRQTG